jgi:hypothetical protein
MQERHYQSIEEIPLFNWQKCLEGDVKYVNLETKEDSGNQEAFNKLYDSFLQKRGVNKEYKKYLDILKKKAMLQCEFLITKDNFKLTQIEIEDAKIVSLQKGSEEGLSIDKTLIYLGKWLGYRLDWKIISVSEFYSILEEYEKQSNIS